MTAYGTIEKAVEAIKKEAYDLIQKPLDEERLIHLLRKGLELNRLVRENARLTETISRKETFGSMVGQSRPMRAVFDKINMLAQSDVTVLIRGETGTGKDLAAQAIHKLSRRGRRKLITVNCPALPETILESELFGYRKGAFTHAIADHTGMFDQADGSSIFLDEIGDLTLPVQTKLLRVLQDKEIRPLGSNRSHMMGQEWPGNTRQLENLIRGWYAVIPDAAITPRHLAADAHPAVRPAGEINLDEPYQDLKEQAIEAFTLEYLNQLLGRTGGNVSAAAQLSGMKRQSLQKIIKRYGIDVQQLR